MFDEVNRLSTAGVDEFRFHSFDGSRLVIIGSFDLCYYHDVEIVFTAARPISANPSSATPARPKGARVSKSRLMKACLRSLPKAPR
jgi:hypothetical protein